MILFIFMHKTQNRKASDTKCLDSTGVPACVGRKTGFTPPPGTSDTTQNSETAFSGLNAQSFGGIGKAPQKRS